MVNYRPYYHWSILLLYIVDILLSNIKHFYMSPFFMQVIIRLQLVLYSFIMYRTGGNIPIFLSQD